MRYRGYVLLILWLLTPTGFGLEAHELEDGVVERDTQLVIYPDRVEIQCTIEMNAATMRKKLRAFDPEVDLTRPQRELWEEYLRVLERTLGKRCDLSVDGQQLSTNAYKSEVIEKHSTRLYCVLQSSLETSTATVRGITFADKNFREHAGYHRVALKGLRRVVIEESNVPPIVSRLPRQSWEELTDSQRDAATKVVAKFTINAGAIK